MSDLRYRDDNLTVQVSGPPPYGEHGDGRFDDSAVAGMFVGVIRRMEVPTPLLLVASIVFEMIEATDEWGTFEAEERAFLEASVALRKAYAAARKAFMEKYGYHRPRDEQAP